MTRRLAVPLLLALAACGGRPEPFRWRDGAPVAFEVRVSETLGTTRIAREIQLAGSGTVRGSAFDLEIVRVRHERMHADGTRSVVATDEVAPSVGSRSTEDAAVARVASALLGRRWTLTFDAERGLLALSGLESALDASADGADPAAADVRDGLRTLVADRAVTRSLRAAGLCAVPADFTDAADSRARTAEVFVLGHGIASLRMPGRAGREKDGSPVLRCSGTLGAGAEFSGSPGEAPPPPIGPAVPEAVRAEAETLYDLATTAPLRGRISVDVPLRGGVTVVTRTSFTVSVGP